MATSIVGPGAMTAQTSLQQSREMQLMQQINAARGTTDDARIDKAAQQFEAMLLSNWLQQAEQSFATIPGADDDEDGTDTTGKDQMMSLGVQSLAESLAASGGIGIARMISKAMHAAAEKASAEAESGSPVPEQAPAGQIGGKN